jgi:hypothetical protein
VSGKTEVGVFWVGGGGRGGSLVVKVLRYKSEVVGSISEVIIGIFH